MEGAGRSPGDIKLRQTVFAIIEEFFEVNGSWKRYAELCVKYRSYDKAVEALNILDRAEVDYSTKNADVYMLWGELHESKGNIGQAIECYRNSGTQLGREKASRLNRR